MSSSDEYDSSPESTIRSAESSIMKSQWDNTNLEEVHKPRKHRDWVDESETQDESSIENPISSRTQYNESEHLTKVQSYVSSVSRRSKVRMDHEIKATSPTKVPTDKMGAYLYGCSSKEVYSSDVDRGCMLSCLQGYRPEDVDVCNHDVYVLEENVLRKVHTSPEKTRSETAYIYTVLLDQSMVRSKLSKIEEVPKYYKVFCTNSIGSAAKFLYEVGAYSQTVRGIQDSEDLPSFGVDEASNNSCPPPPPPPNTNTTMFWTWILIIIVGILAVLGIIWLVMYFMRQPRRPDVIIKETMVVTPIEDTWGTSTPLTGPRKPYSY